MCFALLNGSGSVLATFGQTGSHFLPFVKIPEMTFLRQSRNYNGYLSDSILVSSLFALVWQVLPLG